MPQPRCVLLITTDQQRFDSLPSYGADFAITPNLEWLASQGVVFERCYVPAPVCAPTRASIMSGQFPSAHGVIDNVSWLQPGVPRWTDAARAAGYRTAAIGKMHFAPWDLMEGFEQRITCEDKRHFYIPDDHAQFMKEHGIERPHPKDVPGYFESCGAPDFPFAPELHPDAFIAQQSATWIEQNAAESFVLWVSFVGPHDPYDPPAHYSQLYADAGIPAPIPAPQDPARAPSYRAQSALQPGVENSVFRIDATAATPQQIALWRRHYFGNITLIDEGIGRIVDSLNRAGILDQTVIIFTSDHGDALGDHGMVFKSFFYESMVHVPLIVRDGRHHGRRAALTGTLDVVAYLHDLFGQPAASAVQGRSIGPLLQDKGAVINDCVFSEMCGRAMVFDGRYKYVHAQDGEHELYDLSNDPHELHNIVDNQPLQQHISQQRAALIAHQMESIRLHGESRRTVAYAPRLQMEQQYRRERQQ